MNEFDVNNCFEEQVFQYYNVEAEYEPLKLNENSSLILTFPAGDVSTKIKMFFAKQEQRQLERLIFQAERMAKYSRLILTVVATPTVHILSYSPFTVHFIGSPCIAGFFVKALMASLEPQQHKT